MDDAPITVLRFVSGKYKGCDCPIDRGQVIAGRSSDADLVLADDAVSRKHARFYRMRGGVWVRDLGSRNGTHVNGRSIQHHALRPGDRVLIGSSLARVDVKTRDQLSEPIAGERPQVHAKPEEPSLRAMTGRLEDIPLTDVLQWLGTSRKTGCLAIEDKAGPRRGAVYLDQGQVRSASIEGHPELLPEKALYRLLMWRAGTFELKSSTTLRDGPELGRSFEHILMEAARLEDELAALGKQEPIPTSDTPVMLVKPAPKRWHELSAEQLDLLQSLVELERWQLVLDSSPIDDVTLTRTLLGLKKHGIVAF